MKVVARSTRGKDLFRGTCMKCRATVEASRKELVVRQDQREHYEYAWAKCPECGKGTSNYGGVCFHLVKGELYED